MDLSRDESIYEKARRTTSIEKQVRMPALDSVKPLPIKDIDRDNERDGDLTERGKGDVHHYYSKYCMHLWLFPKFACLSFAAIHIKLVEPTSKSRDKLSTNLQYCETQLATDKKVSTELALLKDEKHFIFDTYGPHKIPPFDPAVAFHHQLENSAWRAVFT